ncbi:nuclear transport factor 2 family protein [Bradyrhizobium sp. Ash2021]|uniref:nuclear transport factor 2 family protein n=1 Tax=Bradyrhizobium sp. Ash2021 TaxID=2954771 RepID=UPI002814F6EF|nr:nuclear transport factor 2 family protein [Bradyrhizobium sp. Ash2021]WMT74523.1 nuclear transport factor 2 family protein [Bradyrhizobium sp. Ash2021]
MLKASAIGMLVGCNSPAPFEADTMISSVPSNAPVALPPLLAAYAEATNSFDLERLMATFADDALVIDQLRDYWGKPAIREWAKRDIVGERLTMNVTKVINNYENFIVTANVDGDYDKRGLPDPLVLAFYFTLQSELIVQLIILRNRFDI